MAGGFAQLVFLGRLADLAGCTEVQVELTEPLTLTALRAQLAPQVMAALDDPRVRLALNGQLLTDPEQLLLGPGDELAFLPPVSGG